MLDAKFIEPINNASRPATLAGLSLTVLRFSSDDPFLFQLVLVIGSIMFLLSSLFIFFYSMYPMNKNLRTLTSITFLLGILCSIFSSVILLAII
jgi:hypothetical protein